MSGKPVLPVFIFDTNILNRLESKVDARLTFLHDQLERMRQAARKVGSDILLMHGRPEEAFENLLNRFHVHAVHANEDYEPYADQRDQAIQSLLEAKNIPFETTTDHVLMAPHEVTKPDGNPYTVFTPFSKRWHANITPSHFARCAFRSALESALSMDRIEHAFLERAWLSAFGGSCP